LDLSGSTHWSAAWTLGPLPVRLEPQALAALFGHPLKEVRRAVIWVFEEWPSPAAAEALRTAAASEDDADLSRMMKSAADRLGAERK
jgi:hypothetical protein